MDFQDLDYNTIVLTLEKIGMHVDHATEIAKDIDYRKMLEDEFNQIVYDQSNLRHFIFKGASNPEIYLPVNLNRLIMNAKREVIDKSAD